MFKLAKFLTMGIVVILLVSCNVTSSESVPDESLPEYSDVKCDNCVNLVVSLDKESYEQGEPITVTVQTSVSDDVEVSFSYMDRPMQDYQISFLNDAGTPVALTEQGIQESSGRRSPRLSGSIFKNTPFQETFSVDPWFDLSAPGHYTLTIEHRVWIPNQEMIVGDSVTFTRLP